MAIEIRVPEAGESIVEVEVGEWLKAEGERVEKDEPIVELVTDKATMELPAPAAGVLGKVLKPSGALVKVGEVIAYLETEGAAAAPKAPVQEPAAAQPQPEAAREEVPVAPAARRLMAEHGLSPRDVKGSGPGGRILKEDVLRAIEAKKARPSAPEPAPAPAPTPQPAPAPRQAPPPPPAPAAPAGYDAPWRYEEAVPMSPLRRRIAQRLVEAQQTMAMLTTFNEADMSAVLALRRELGERFKEKYGVKLGIMSFFVKAVIQALKEIPELNAEIRDNHIIYKRYYDIGIAIGVGEALVVPVLRDADRMSFADIERAIADFAERARAKKLRPEELQGGTFSITNGGVFGSLNSTPIINPPQVGILGMHAIQERPVGRNGEIVLRPMMNLALSYDHRIVDGREAVTFLRRVKECIENPARLLIEV